MTQKFDYKESTRLNTRDKLGFAALLIVVFLAPAAYIVLTQGWLALLSDYPKPY